MNIRAGCVGTVIAALSVIVSPTEGAAQMMDHQIYTFFQFDQLEYRQSGGSNPVAWEMDGWIGGDFNRFWIKSEGARSTVGNSGDAELQSLFSRLIAPFWEIQVGARLDAAFGNGNTEFRGLAVFGFEGLAPYWFELEPVVFVSHKGDVSARLTASYDVFVTQRLIGQPRMELNVAVQDVPEFGVGSGLSDLELGLRLRYELQRKTAPYIGVNWERRFGDTAAIARAVGEDVSELAAVGGVRVWF